MTALYIAGCWLVFVGIVGLTSYIDARVSNRKANLWRPIRVKESGVKNPRRGGLE